MELSLFKDDPMHRFFKKVRLEKEGVTHKWYFALIIIVAGWLIPAILSALEGHAVADTIIQSFFLDPNHPVEIVIIILLLFSEDYLDLYIRTPMSSFGISVWLRMLNEYKEPLEL